MLLTENKQLRRKLEQARERLTKTELIVDLQKKLSAIMYLDEPTNTGRSDALEDPGMFRADIIYNLANKFAAQGFVHIPLIRSGGFTQTELYIHSQRGLVEGINRGTNIRVVLDAPYEGIRWQFRKIGVPLIKEAPNERGIPMRSLLAYRPPLVYLLADRLITLTPYEEKALRDYLGNGGVLVLENARPGNEALRVRLREFISGLVGNATVKPALLPIPPRPSRLSRILRPVRRPPRRGRAGDRRGGPHRMQPYLEGIRSSSRLLAIYSDKGYGLVWAAEEYNSEAMKMGINLMVCALVQ